MSNHNEYAIVNEYKYVHESALIENTRLSLEVLKGTLYQLDRSTNVKAHLWCPTTITSGAQGTSGYTTANNHETRGGSGQGMRVNITVWWRSNWCHTQYRPCRCDFAYNYMRTLTIIQSGSTNDATVVITAVADRNGQRYFDINNHHWDSTNNTYQKETTYAVQSGAGNVIVAVDGVIQLLMKQCSKVQTLMKGLAHQIRLLI